MKRKNLEADDNEQSLITQTDQLCVEGKFDEAISILKNLLLNKPQSPWLVEIHQQLGIVYSSKFKANHLQDNGQAISHFIQSIYHALADKRINEFTLDFYLFITNTFNELFKQLRYNDPNQRTTAKNEFKMYTHLLESAETQPDALYDYRINNDLIDFGLSEQSVTAKKNQAHVLQLSHSQIEEINRLSESPHSLFKYLNKDVVSNICSHAQYDANEEYDRAFIQACAHAGKRELKQLNALLTQNPRLLLSAGTITNQGGVTVKQVTLLEFALGDGDPDLVEMLLPHFDQIKDDGEAEKKRQLNRYKEFLLNLLKQNPVDIEPIIQQYIKSTEQEISAVVLLNINQSTPLSELHKLVIKFRKQVDARLRIDTPGMHYNYQTIVSILTILLRELAADKAMYSSGKTKYPNLDLFVYFIWLLFGYAQRALPLVDRFAFARGFGINFKALKNENPVISNELINEKPIILNNHYEDKDIIGDFKQTNHYKILPQQKKISLQFFPAYTDPHFHKLGFSHAIVMREINDPDYIYWTAGSKRFNLAKRFPRSKVTHGPANDVETKPGIYFTLKGYQQHLERKLERFNAIYEKVFAAELGTQSTPTMSKKL